MNIFDDIYNEAGEYIGSFENKPYNPKISISFPNKPNSKYSFPYERHSQVPFEERLKGEFFLFIANYKESPDENDDWYAPTEELFIKYRITLLKEESLTNQYWADYVDFLTNRIKNKELNKRYSTGEPKAKPEFSINEIALRYVFEGKTITRPNSNEEAQRFGHSSGEKLFQRFTWYSSKSNRNGEETPSKLKNKIELFEKVIKVLPDQYKQKAIDELKILTTIKENNDY